MSRVVDEDDATDRRWPIEVFEADHLLLARDAWTA